jgi:manganese/iron transport system permease protein
MVELITEPLEFEFFKRAVFELVLVGLLCGVVGSLVVLRGLAFIGDALAHAIFPGVVIAFLLKQSFFAGGLIFGLLTALLIGVVARNRRISQDTAIGILFAGMFALGIVLISTADTYTRDLSSFLIGNVLAISEDDVSLTIVVSVVVLTVVGLLYKELQLVAFDPTSAKALGYPVFLIDLLLLGMITVTIVVSLQALGNILVLAFLVTPAATARLLVDRLPPMMALAAAIAAVNGVAGLYLSYYFDIAGGGAIVMLTTAVFFVTFLLAPTHGLLARHVRPSLQGEAAGG